MEGTEHLSTKGGRRRELKQSEKGKEWAPRVDLGWRRRGQGERGVAAWVGFGGAVKGGA